MNGRTSTSAAPPSAANRLQEQLGALLAEEGRLVSDETQPCLVRVVAAKKFCVFSLLLLALLIMQAVVLAKIVGSAIVSYKCAP